MRRNRYFARRRLVVCLGMTWSILAAQAAGPVSNETPPHQHGSVSKESHANRHMRRTDFQTLVERFENPDRLRWQKPDLVIQKLGDLSSKTIADIGAGTGYFAFPLAELAGKVLAIDIDQRFLDLINKKNEALEKPLPIETRLVTEHDPLLMPGETDVVLVANTYHHIMERTEYFRAVREKLATNGLLAIVDFKKEELPVGPPVDIKLSPGSVVDELDDAGFSNISVDTQSLEYQYIILAR